MKTEDLKLSLNQLLLDPNNYRLDYEVDTAVYDEKEFLSQQMQTQERLERERLGELRASILQNGFLEMDRIVVRKLDAKFGRSLYVIVEGNRRAAAFKGLIEDYHEGIRDLPRDLIEKSKSIGVICVEGTADEVKEFSAGLMGIRHVSGPKKWSGYQSARLIHDMAASGRSLTEIGSLLGITAKDAGRRLRGYSAVAQMRADTDFGVKSSNHHYTLLLEFLSPSRRGREWLEWNDKDFVFENKDNLHRVYAAITVDDEGEVEISNPDDARTFLRFIESPSHCEMIENNRKLCDLPPLDSGDKARRKRMEDFLYLIKTISANEISVDELAILKNISCAVRDVISGGGRDE